MKKSKKATKDEKPGVIFVNAWVYAANCGDGSASVNFFNEEAEAEAYAAPDDERFCDDIFPVTLVIDPETKRICNVKKRKSDD